MIRAHSHGSTIVKLTLVSACAAMVLLWPTWRVALAGLTYYFPFEGRMTGGGNCTVGDVKVTHGFQLHCNALGDESNNLEVNWQDGTGTGTYDGSSLALATWVFRDLGEPGKDHDTFEITIVAPGSVRMPALSISCILEGGNHQAHPE